MTRAKVWRNRVDLRVAAVRLPPEYLPRLAELWAKNEAMARELGMLAQAWGL